MRRLLLSIVLLLALVVPLAACGDDGGGTGEEGSGGGIETTPVTFGDGDEVWLRVQTGGGFVPYIDHLRESPRLLLYDDGRLVRLVVTDEYPVIVPEYEVVQLDESATAELLDTFAAVVDGPDVGDPPVTDLPTTTIQVTTDGDTRELSIYALGFTDGLDDDEVAAREAAEDAIESADDLEGAEPFVPDEWLVIDATVSPGTCTRDRDLGDLSGADPLTEVAIVPVLTGDETCPDGFVEQ